MAPILADAFKHSLDLAGYANVERQQDRGRNFVGEWLDEPLGLVVEIGDGKLRAERAECLGATPGDRLIVGDTDDEALADCTNIKSTTDPEYEPIPVLQSATTARAVPQPVPGT